METVIQNPEPHNPRQQSEDDEAKQLFNDLSMSDGNPFQNLQLSSQNQQQSPIEENAEDDNKQKGIDFRQMIRMSKKQKKKEKKMLKIKQAKARKQSRKQNRNENIKQNEKSNYKPGKKMLLDSSEDEAQKQSKREQQSINLKIKKSSKKAIRNSDDEDKLPSEKSDDSDEYSSENNESQNDELGKMDPNSQEQGKREFKKKLGKKSRKQRILQKQGFDLRQLGNDAEANYELNQSINQSDDSFSDGGRRKKGNKRVKKDKKQKKPKLTNQQFLGKLQQLGREDQIDQDDADRYNYDSGLNQLQKLRPKRQSQNKIKIQNKLFGNIDLDIEQENQQNQLPMPEEKLQLDIKPKSFTSSRASSFLSKVETLKKHRGLQADINQEEFDKITKEKAKRSITQLMSKIQQQVEDNEEIDIQIKAPTIAKGKSADLINNTMFIVKSLSQKQSSNVSSTDNGVSDVKNASSQQLNKPVQKPQQQKPPRVLPTPVLPLKNRKGVSRTQFFKQIRQSINVRKSKYISDEQLKNSMKASKLQQLQEIRKRIQQKRRKQAMYEMGEVEDDDADNVISELQADLARKRGVSVEEYRRMLRQEEGIEGLEDYQEEKDNKKKKQAEEQKPEPKVVLQLSVQQGAKPISNQPLPKPSQSSQEQQKLKKLLQLKKQLRIKKALAMEQGQEQKIQEQQSNRHADDMIQQYEGIDEQLKDQIDLQHQAQDGEEEEEEQDGDYNEQEGQEEEDDCEMKDQNEEAQENQQENMPKQQQELINKPQTIRNQENPQIRQQLQDQGIIMPGNKKKILKNQQPQQLDVSKYMLDNPNGQPIVPQALTQPIVKQTLKIDQQTLQFKQFKKLRKFAVLIQQKKKKRQQQLKRAKQFFQQQAQLGSDNQQNDDNIKAINKKDDQQQQDGDDLDQQLQQLIDNAVDINEADEQQAFKKYMQDVKQKDREELQRILRGEFRRPNQDMPEIQEMQQDQRNRIQRMERMVEWMRKRQQDENGMYAEDEEDQQIEYYYDKYGKKKRVEQRKNHNSQDNAQDSPEEDNHELEKKLQFYLMDTISPAKKDTQIDINTDLIMELPMMTRKSTMSKLNTFNKKSQQPTSSSIAESTPVKPKQTPSKSTFAGNLLNLAAAKGQSNSLPMPKMKKTSSHMSEVLNKNKSQKPAVGFTNFKLPGIFNRLVKK